MASNSYQTWLKECTSSPSYQRWLASTAAAHGLTPPEAEKYVIHVDINRMRQAGRRPLGFDNPADTAAYYAWDKPGEKPEPRCRRCGNKIVTDKCKNCGELYIK